MDDDDDEFMSLCGFCNCSLIVLNTEFSLGVTVLDGSRVSTQSCFSFTRFINMSPAELNSIMTKGLYLRYVLLHRWLQRLLLLCYHHLYHTELTYTSRYLDNKCLLLEQDLTISSFGLVNSLCDLIFTKPGSRTYTHTDHVIHDTAYARVSVYCENLVKRKSCKVWKSIPAVPHQNNASSAADPDTALDSCLTKIESCEEDDDANNLSFTAVVQCCMGTELPPFVYYNVPKVVVRSHGCYTNDRSAEWQRLQEANYAYATKYTQLLSGFHRQNEETENSASVHLIPTSPLGIKDIGPKHGFSNIYVPDKESLVTDAGKLTVLDRLLTKLKEENHRVLIYSQMTRMIDILEEYLWYRKHTYMRLDGSSKISDRRDMVADFQKRSDIFVFLLSTRAGGLGINLTAADTVIFYDSDWNPTVDQQAMDRAHRLGQTKQVTVYRLICKGTIEERILQRAKEKSEIQRMVITGGNFAPDILKPKEVVSLLLDDDEMERKLQQRQDERKLKDDMNKEKDVQRKRKLNSYKVKSSRGPGRPPKKLKLGDGDSVPQTQIENVTIPAGDESSQISMNSASAPPSPHSECLSVISEVTQKSGSVADDESCDGVLVVDDTSDHNSSSVTPSSGVAKRGSGRPRGRPRGSSSTQRSRGRGSIQKSLSAAEAAAAVAARKAAYAAYGYSFTDCPSPSSAQLCPGNVSYTAPTNLRRSPDTNAVDNFQM